MPDKPHISIERKEDCCGCRSCEQICPQQCISMQEDFEGFRYPAVNDKKCVHCGLCLTHCPMITDPVVSNRLKEPEVFAARLKDDALLMQSSSGGMFTAFAKSILKQKGVVFGCAFDENLVARHICVEKEVELERLRGSKYVASDPNSVYTQVRRFLKENRKVLFTGCGCQIAGLRKFLGKDYENLLTMEIICHGTPSQKLFSKHIEHLSQKMGEKILSYEFRNKQEGWGLNYKTKTKTKTKTIFLPADKDPYYASFLRGKTYRPCCFECHFAKQERMADITVGDFWGIELFHPDFYDYRGVSGLMLNTVAGQNAWKLLQTEVVAIPSNFAEFSRRNGNLIRPTKRPEARENIYQSLDNLSYAEFSERLKLRGKEKLLSTVKNSLPKSVRILINRLLFKFMG
jgi:coenzyme F420-reducing hydrogenase beta subunit